MLTLSHVSKTYYQPDGDITVLADVNLHLPAGKTAALLGESGSGKSTLLHLVAGLDKPDSGTVEIDGQQVTSFSESQWNTLRCRTLSLVFQQYHLVPTLSVLDNILLQARLAGRVDAGLQHRLVEALGLGELLKRLPFQLSGGQQQRVAIARALMHQPRLILADEPTGNLDEATGQDVMRLFVELVQMTGSSLLMVTHSREMASYMDCRWRLHHGVISNVAAVVEDNDTAVDAGVDEDNVTDHEG
jgi:putative ABC transport system ATP-binding protein